MLEGGSETVFTPIPESEKVALETADLANLTELLTTLFRAIRPQTHIRCRPLLRRRLRSRHSIPNRRRDNRRGSSVGRLLNRDLWGAYPCCRFVRFGSTACKAVSYFHVTLKNSL